MNRMDWHITTQSYQGLTSDGRTVNVTGDEWLESVEDAKVTLAGNLGIETELLSEDQIEEIKNSLDNPDMWAGLVGVNPNVEFI